MSGRSVFSESEKVCLQELIVKYKLNSVATIGAGNPAVKKTAWTRLTEEYNSIETNSKRTEAQLKKCWDNLKTRRKQALALEKRERMKTGGGSYKPPPSTSTSQGCSQETIDEALLDATDVELQYVVDSDSVTQEFTLPESEVMQVEPTTPLLVNVQLQPDRADPGITLEVPTEAVVPSRTHTETVRGQINPNSRSGSRLSDYAEPQTRTQGTKDWIMEEKCENLMNQVVQSRKQWGKTCNDYAKKTSIMENSILNFQLKTISNYRFKFKNPVPKVDVDDMCNDIDNFALEVLEREKRIEELRKKVRDTQHVVFQLKGDAISRKIHQPLTAEAMLMEAKKKIVTS